jgi:hypothetical protein
MSPETKTYVRTSAACCVDPMTGSDEPRSRCPEVAAPNSAAHRLGVALIWSALPRARLGREWLKKGLLCSKQRCPLTRHRSDSRRKHAYGPDCAVGPVAGAGRERRQCGNNSLWARPPRSGQHRSARYRDHVETLLPGRAIRVRTVQEPRSLTGVRTPGPGAAPDRCVARNPGPAGHGSLGTGTPTR